MFAERNEDAKYYVNAKLLRAETLQESDFHDLRIATPEVRNLLTNLIEIHAKGFRGVVRYSLRQVRPAQCGKKHQPTE